MGFEFSAHKGELPAPPLQSRHAPTPHTCLPALLRVGSTLHFRLCRQRVIGFYKFNQLFSKIIVPAWFNRVKSPRPGEESSAERRSPPGEESSAGRRVPGRGKSPRPGEAPRPGEQHPPASGNRQQRPPASGNWHQRPPRRPQASVRKQKQRPQQATRPKTRRGTAAPLRDDRRPPQKNKPAVPAPLPPGNKKRPHMVRSLPVSSDFLLSAGAAFRRKTTWRESPRPVRQVSRPAAWRREPRSR